MLASDTTGSVPSLAGDAEAIGIDLGGSAIKLGRFRADGTCLEATSIPTPTPPDPLAVLSAIAAAVEPLNRHRKALAIGIGTPGPSDPSCRVARVAINLPGWIDVPVADILEAKIGLPTVVENDANCAGLGEAWCGAGRGFSSSILLTLGTGVGGAIILDNQLFAGSRGLAGELGLVTVDYNGPPCNSGNRGSLEQFACARAIARQTGKTPAELGALAQGGDREALAFWEQYGQLLAAGIASSVYVLAPEAVILGGGIASSAAFFLPALEAELTERVPARTRFEVCVLPAELGNRAGMTGAAKLAWLSLGMASA